MAILTPFRAQQTIIFTYIYNFLQNLNMKFLVLLVFRDLNLLSGEDRLTHLAKFCQNGLNVTERCEQNVMSVTQQKTHTLIAQKFLCALSSMLYFIIKRLKIFFPSRKLSAKNFSLGVFSQKELRFNREQEHKRFYSGLIKFDNYVHFQTLQ